VAYERHLAGCRYKLADGVLSGAVVSLSRSVDWIATRAIVDAIKINILGLLGNMASIKQAVKLQLRRLQARLREAWSLSLRLGRTCTKLRHIV